MIDYSCHCGRRYRFPSRHAGKRVRCKACDETFTIPAPPPDPPVDEDAPLPLAESTRAPTAAPPDLRQAADGDVPSAPSGDQGDDDAAPLAGGWRGFWIDVARTPIVLAGAHNAATIGVAVGFIVLATIGAEFLHIGALSWLLSAFAGGVLVVFYMEILRSVSGGDDDLPDLSDWEGFFESFAEPLFEYFGTLVLLLGPAIGYQQWLEFHGQPLEGEARTTFIVLAGVGLFFWPVCILAVSQNGLSALMRIDVLSWMVVRNIGPYLATVALVYAAHFLTILAIDALEPKWFWDRPKTETGRFFLLTSTSTLSVLSEIVAMRMIGLFYRRFSDRMP